MTDLFFRAFVGPRFAPLETYWTNFNVGAASDLDYATTLTSTLTNGHTFSMALASVLGFAAQPAGVWVGPNGSGQAWEYVRYTGLTGTSGVGTLTTLTREPSANREHNGVHSAGATVMQWMPVETDGGSLRIVRELNDALCATSWYAELAGLIFPQRCLRNDHAILIQSAVRPSGSWTNLLLGWIDSPSVSDTWEKKSEWRVRIMCVAGVIGYTQARGVRVGEWDIAREASVNGSPPISGAWKEYGSPDFDGTLRSFEVEQVIDGRSDTLWIADQMVGTINNGGAGIIGIEQMHINPTPSLGVRGNKWIVITKMVDLGHNHLLCYRSVDDALYILTDLPAVELDDREYFVICESEAAFRAQNPAAEPDALFDLETLGSPGNDAFTYLDPAGGCIALKFTALTGGTSFTSVLCWGSQTEVPDLEAFEGADWDAGTSIAAPGKGETMRRVHQLTPPPSTEADFWDVSYRQSPAYLIDTDANATWVKLDLPGMEVELAADVSATVLTLPLRWGDTPSSDGLPASGTVLIDEEEIAYTGKTASTLTGCTRHVNGSTAALHLKGTKVRIFADFVPANDFGPVATDGYPLQATAWYMENGSTVPRDSDLLLTPRSDGRNPSEAEYARDYPLLIEHNDNAAASYEVAHSPALHTKTLVWQCGEVSINPGRPRLTRLRALVDRGLFDSAYWVDTGQAVEQTLDRLALNAGVPAAATTVVAGGMALDGHTTAVDAVWPVLEDLADYGGSYIAIDLDSKMLFRPNFIWSTGVGSFVVSYIWAAVDLQRVEKVWGRGGAVSQVKLNWNLPDGVEQEAAVYPTTPAATGRIEEVGPYIYPNETAALLAARKRFYLSRYPYTALAQLAVGDLAINPGAVVNLHWQFDREMQEIDRLYLTKSVEHMIEGGALVTTVNLIEIDREAA